MTRRLREGFRWSWVILIVAALALAWALSMRGG